MSVAGADIAKAVSALWDSSGLNARFTAYWTATQEAQFDVLNDMEASPQNAFPYCVFELEGTETVARMSGVGDVKREIRDAPLTFRIHAKQVSGDARTAKNIVAALAEEVIKVFGGHTSVGPSEMALDNGNFLISQYQTDYGVRTEDDVWSWVISYTLRLDVPLAVGDDESESSESSWSSFSSLSSITSMTSGP